MNKLTSFLLGNLEDIFIFCGLLLIIVATFIISFVGGMYITGAILLMLGIYFAKYPIRKGR